MTRSGVTLQDVISTAEKILANGENPTIEKIRVSLGTGSNSTISKYLHEWRSKRLIATAELPKSDTPPDAVNEAVLQVWQQMKEKTEGEIAAIKREAQSAVEEALKQLGFAEKALADLQGVHHELEAVHQAQAAEKELLLLDIKSIRGEQALLHARYDSLDKQHSEMQRETSRHLTDMTDAHLQETKRLDEKYIKQEEHHCKLMDKVKQQYQKEHDQHLINIDSLKVEAIKKNELTKTLEDKLKEKEILIARLEVNLQRFSSEQEDTSKRINEQDKIINSMLDKTLVPDAILSKLYDQPTLDNFIEKINNNMAKAIDNRVIEFKKIIESLNLVQYRETQDE